LRVAGAVADHPGMTTAPRPLNWVKPFGLALTRPAWAVPARRT
jgi:hypothetical protein